MLAGFLHDINVRYTYENHRSKTYQETASGVGVHRVLRFQSVYAETSWMYKGNDQRDTLSALLGCRSPPVRGRGRCGIYRLGAVLPLSIA